jgi:hypothetical protein
MISGLIVAASAQVTTRIEIDVAGGIAGGWITATKAPASVGSEVDDLFDGQEGTAFGGTMLDSASVTLEFDQPVYVSWFKQEFITTSAEYSLEFADNIADLDARTGSYVSLVDHRSYAANTADSVTYDSAFAVGVARLTLHETSFGVYCGEWSMGRMRTYEHLVVTPSPPRLIPGKQLKLGAALADAAGMGETYEEADLSWSSSDPDVASFEDENSILTANDMGTTLVTVSSSSTGLTGQAYATVEPTFVNDDNAETITVKVAVVYHDPVLPQTGQLYHVSKGYFDPRDQNDSLVAEFERASHGVLDIEIVEEIDDTMLFSYDPETMEYITVSDLYSIYGREGLKYDYDKMVRHYNFYEKRQNDEIHEVWVWCHTHGGMWESHLMGKNAFWWNSGPFANVPEDFTKLISVMGFNFERSIDLAMHSMGHRMESAMRHAFGRWENDGYSQISYGANLGDEDVFEHDCCSRQAEHFAKEHAPTARGEEPPVTATMEGENMWELFTSFVAVEPDNAHLGNCHFPHNGTSHYDYGNNTVVASRADAWDRYPYIFENEDTRSFSWAEWNMSSQPAHLRMGFFGDQHGWMRYWYSHMPHHKGVTNGVLNNWWHYFVFPLEADALAAQTPVGTVDVRRTERGAPDEFALRQNYPNPFNPTTTISYELQQPARVEIKVYDALGSLVETLYAGAKQPGTHRLTWNAANHASGVYFARLQTADGASVQAQTIKMMLLK